MDTGLLEPSETLQDVFDVSSHISAAETLGIMDEILCLEVSLSNESIFLPLGLF